MQPNRDAMKINCDKHVKCLERRPGHSKYPMNVRYYDGDHNVVSPEPGTYPSFSATSKSCTHFHYLSGYPM